MAWGWSSLAGAAVHIQQTGLAQVEGVTAAHEALHVTFHVREAALLVGPVVGVGVELLPLLALLHLALSGLPAAAAHDDTAVSTGTSPNVHEVHLQMSFAGDTLAP